MYELGVVYRNIQRADRATADAQAEGADPGTDLRRGGGQGAAPRGGFARAARGNAFEVAVDQHRHGVITQHHVGFVALKIPHRQPAV